MRIVIKFGGTSLENGERIEKAADKVQALSNDGHEVSVVASAMGNTTDELLDEIEFSAGKKERDEIVSMGERTSVRMLKASLNSRGIDCDYYEPGKEGWPVKVDKEGQVIEDTTRKRARELSEGLEDEVPVVTGFLAEDPEGNTATLGRGGSDTTAMMLGNYMDADKVIIVTDVEGVLTGNPDIVESTHNVGNISVDEIHDLSFKGAEVIAPESLPYKNESLDVSVVHFQNGNVLNSGTSIEGEFERIINTDSKKFASLTVAGREIRLEEGILAELSSKLEKENINIEAVSTGMDSVTFFVEEEEAGRADEVLHSSVLNLEKLSSVTVDENVGVVRVAGGRLPDRPGVIEKIVNPIAKAKININEIITSASSIIVFVNYNDRKKALELVQNNFGE